MHEYRQIIYRLRANQSVRCICKESRFGRNTVKRVKEISEQKGWLSRADLPSEAEISHELGVHRSSGGTDSKATPHGDLIKKWSDSDIKASVIYQHLKSEYAYTGSYNSIQRFVQKYKNEQPPKLTVPLNFSPGEAAQIDFGKGPKLFDERIKKEVDTWFFVMTLCWSRHQYAELIVHQDIETWLNCHQKAFDWFGGVVDKLIIDNPKCAITKACYHDPEVQRSYESLAQSYGFLISACPPRDPQKKGRVESGVKYVKGNFLPLRQFRSLQDANIQLQAWVLGTAGNRIHGSVFEKPLTRFEEIEKNQLKSLPATGPDLGVWKKVNLYKDCHIRYLKCGYSAPYLLYGKALWLKATSGMVYIYHEHQEVAVHARAFKAGEYRTKIEHLPPDAKTYFQQDAAWCTTHSQRIGEACSIVVEHLLTDPIRELLRQAQSLLRLEKKFGARRLELACKRAIAFNAMNYKTVQHILKEGIEYEALKNPEVFEQLSQVYRGKAVYQREFSTTKH